MTKLVVLSSNEFNKVTLCLLSLQVAASQKTVPAKVHSTVRFSLFFRL